MSYYMRGDYRTGGYYRGDPGLFSFAKRLVKKAPQIIGGFVSGGPIGAVQAGFSPTVPGRQTVPIAQAGIYGAPVAAGMGMVPAVIKAAPKILPKVLKTLGIGGAGLAAGEIIESIFENGGCCPSGYHPAKDGSGRCVRNRRMNVANPRALRRSIRRLSGFEKMVKRTRKSLRAAARI